MKKCIIDGGGELCPGTCTKQGYCVWDDAEVPALNIQKCDDCDFIRQSACKTDYAKRFLAAADGTFVLVPPCMTFGEAARAVEEHKGSLIERVKAGLDTVNPKDAEEHKGSLIERVKAGLDTVNPKDALGDAKPQVGLMPMVEAVVRVFELGAKKYGPLNWRSKAVRKMVYAHAALRHIFAWIGGQDKDPESGESHLAHAAACLLIVLDADARGKAVEDREWVK